MCRTETPFWSIMTEDVLFIMVQCTFRRYSEVGSTPFGLESCQRRGRFFILFKGGSSRDFELVKRQARPSGIVGTVVARWELASFRPRPPPVKTQNALHEKLFWSIAKIQSPKFIFYFFHNATAPTAP
jgi:hypothetical protein